MKVSVEPILTLGTGIVYTESMRADVAGVAPDRKLLVDFCVVAAAIPLILWSAYAANFSPELTVSLYYLIPTLYLLARSRKQITNILFASSVLGVLYGMAWNIVLEVHNAFTIVYHSAVLNIRVIGETPLGDFWWAFLAPLYLFVFYEHFLAGKRPMRLSHNAKLLTRVGVSVFFLTWLMLIVFPNFPQIPYAFFVLGLPLALPLLALPYLNTGFRKKVLAATLFFLIVNISNDVSLLLLHAGGFYGQYVGWMPLPFGSIPLEEFVFWCVLSTPALLIVYEWAFGDFS